MKIDILTFSKTNNFGANLQAYALSIVLKKMGHVVEFIDIRLKQNTTKLHGVFLYKYHKIKMDIFRNKYFPFFTKQYKTSDELRSDVPNGDAFIVGSDQVWNTDLTKNFALSFFLDFAPADKLKIAYAASFGKESFENENKNQFQDSLMRFNSISVRENSGKSILKNVFNLYGDVVLDPTLLLDNYDHIYKASLKNNNELISFKYVQSSKYYVDLLKLGRELGLIPVSLNNIKPLKGYKYRPLCSIEKWIGSIANASFIVTDSFHCMAFAILYKKNFVILPGKPDRLTRLTNLLKILNIEDRFCENIPEIINRGIHTKQINYTQVHEILHKQRENSLNFLLRSLNNQ